MSLTDTMKGMICGFRPELDPKSFDVIEVDSIKTEFRMFKITHPNSEYSMSFTIHKDSAENEKDMATFCNVISQKVMKF